MGAKGISPIKVQPAKHKVRHRKVRQGQTIYKGHPSWNIMLNIKLGISYTVGRVSPEEKRKLRREDFTAVTKQVFPPEGGHLTPGHSADVFTFKDHAPLAFRHLREHWGVDAQEYMVSICGDHSLRELGTPGKSGAVFYITDDNKFLIKTVSRKESKFLRSILPNYYNYVMRSPNSLIPRFLGLIRITSANRRNIRLAIMNYLIPDEYHIHEKYDLKGSTLGRYATEEEKRDANATLKDLDFKHCIALEPKKLATLRAQVEADSMWLRTLRIMDFSMLCMLHFPRRPVPEERDGYDDRSSVGSEGMVGSVRSERMGETCSADASSSYAGVGGDSSITGRIRGALGGGVKDADDSDDDDDSSTVSSLGLPKLTDEDFASAYDISAAHAANGQSRRRHALAAGFTGVTTGPDGGEEVVILAGLIDILQQYGARKKLEHSFKSLKYRNERAGISVTDPARYSERFTRFMLSKFVSAPPGTISDGSSDVEVLARDVGSDVSPPMTPPQAGGSGNSPPRTPPRAGSPPEPSLPNGSSAGTAAKVAV